MNLLYSRYEVNTRKNLWRLTIPIVGIHLAITLPLVFILNIWIDEAYTLDTTKQGLSYAFSQAINFEEQAPLYFCALTLWRSINDSTEFARLFSVLCAVLTLCLIPKLSQRFIPTVSFILPTIIVALNPFIIWAALEIRLYALSTLLSALLLLWFYDGYLKDSPERSNQWLYIGTAILSLYTHYFLGLILVAHGIVLLCQNQRRLLRRYFWDMVIILVASIPMILIVLHQLQFMSDNALPSVNESASYLLINSFKKTIGMFFLYILPAPAPKDWVVLRFSLLLGLIGLIIWYHRALNLKFSDAKCLSLILITVSLIGAFITMFMLVKDLPYRHANALFIPGLLTTIALLSCTEKLRRPLLPVATILILGLSSLSLGSTYVHLAKPGDYRRVSTYLMSQEQPHQPILVFNAEVDMVLKHYYKGENVSVPLPKALSFQRFVWKDLMLQSQQDIETAIANVADHASTIWLVKDTKTLKEQPSYTPSYEILERYLEQNYRIIEQKDFYGSSVQQLWHY